MLVRLLVSLVRKSDAEAKPKNGEVRAGFDESCTAESPHEPWRILLGFDFGIVSFSAKVSPSF